MGGGRPSICVPAAKVRRSVWVMRVTPPAPSVCHTPSCPDGARALVETDQRRAGRRPLERAFDPPLPEGVEVRQHRDPRNEVQRIPVAPLAVPRHPLADQRPSAHRHRAGRRAAERRSSSPGIDDRAPQRRASEDLGDETWIAAHEVEERPRPRSGHDVRIADVCRLCRRKLLDRETETPEPSSARSRPPAPRPVGRPPSRGRTRRRRPRPSPRHGRSARCPG